MVPIHDNRSKTDEAPVRAALRAGERAPSVCNTRPWALTHSGSRIAVSVDVDRRLEVSDPKARELVISCGAALYNIRTALRAHGVLPKINILPDPERPGLLAEIDTTHSVEPSNLDLLLYPSIGKRRTHRGPFTADVDDVRLVRALSTAAATEGAALRLITDKGLVQSLAGLVAAAEHVQRHERSHAEELARWVRSPGSRRPDGIHAEDFPPEERVTDAEFPERDYGQNRIPGMLDVHGEVTGTIALLTTVADTRSSHLAAGQALQRLLLTATAEGVSAAFHTQPLEEPLLRAFITERLCEGAHAQMILRLGREHQRTPNGGGPISPLTAGS
ncbi:Acg family FMN-binding oxidoreductase [Salinactinospora qingdaonensis]|uniref:NAD(P)H nitroreductase n=1 Tax=Salinactinospora qingdaonensis TaxID=702744 RepID=A0ABP7GKQ1_9ACTN